MKLKTIIIFTLLLTTTLGFCQSVDCFVTKKFKVGIFPDTYVLYDLGTLKRFTPTRLEVMQVEKALLHEIKHFVKSGSSSYLKDRKRIYRHFNQYSRLYFGYINSKGEKIIYIQSYSNSFLKMLKEPVDKDGCISRYISVDDGGSNIWGIKFNLNTKAFFGFGTNGYA